MKKLVLVLALAAAPAMAQVIASSGFNTGTEGWKVIALPHEGPYEVRQAGSEPEFRRTGGQSGGYIRQRELDRETNYWVAPAEFLGNKAAAYGGRLRFTIRIEHSGGEYYDGGDVVLLSTGLVLVYVLPEKPSKSWQSFTVPLATGGWKKTGLKGAAATAQELRRVLVNLKGLLIRGEYIDGSDVSCLDFVSLEAGQAGASVSEDATSGRTIRIPDWIPRYRGVEYRGIAQGESGDIYLTTLDPSDEVIYFYMEGFRLAGCNPKRTGNSGDGLATIRGTVPSTGHTFTAAISPDSDGTRVSIQYGPY